jgi:glutathione S-transferase
MYRLVTANRNYSSWSLRAWLLMRMLEIPFEDRQVSFASGDNWTRFRPFSPSGTVPTLIDGDRTIWDSLAIALYLADRHDGVWPKDEEARTWAQSAVAEMHGGFVSLRRRCPMNVGVRVERLPDPPGLIRDVARISELFQEGISRFGGLFLAGRDFTVADAFYAPVVFRVRTHGLDLALRAEDYVERMLALPAMREWENMALNEAWVDDSELERGGRIIADYRRVGAGS